MNLDTELKDRQVSLSAMLDDSDYIRVVVGPANRQVKKEIDARMETDPLLYMVSTPDWRDPEASVLLGERLADSFFHFIVITNSPFVVTAIALQSRLVNAKVKFYLAEESVTGPVLFDITNDLDRGYMGFVRRAEARLKALTQAVVDKRERENRKDANENGD